MNGRPMNGQNGHALPGGHGDMQFQTTWIAQDGVQALLLEISMGSLCQRMILTTEALDLLVNLLQTSRQKRPAILVPSILTPQ